MAINYKSKSTPTSARQIPSAIRHGAYSATTVLPGEDQAAFDKLHRDLISEFSPNGVSEQDIVLSIAHYTWRKQNLETLRIAKRAQHRLSQVLDEMLEAKFPGQTTNKTHPQSEKIIRVAEDRVREELGDAYELIEVGEAASFKNLDEELALEGRFGIMIDRFLRRLLFVRGLKSMSGAVVPQRIAAPTVTYAKGVSCNQNRGEGDDAGSRQLTT